MAVCIPDMKMPENCKVCPMICGFRTNGEPIDFCGLYSSIRILDQCLMIEDSSKRHPECPLKECPHSTDKD